MSYPYVGEIRILPYLRGAPSGWQICDGSLIAINASEILYTLLGTTYGGDGVNTFGVPDLRSRVPVHQGTGGGLSPRSLGQSGGEEAVTLLPQQMGAHNHFMLASATSATSNAPANMVLAAVGAPTGEVFYNLSPTQGAQSTFPATAIQPAGGNQPHDNTAPTLTLQYCIALEGIFPPQS